VTSHNRQTQLHEQTAYWLNNATALARPNPWFWLTTSKSPGHHPQAAVHDARSEIRAAIANRLFCCVRASSMMSAAWPPNSGGLPGAGDLSARKSTALTCVENLAAACIVPREELLPLDTSLISDQLARAFDLHRSGGRTRRSSVRRPWPSQNAQVFGWGANGVPGWRTKYLASPTTFWCEPTLYMLLCTRAYCCRLV
jgi:hypothetical protein